MRKIKHRNNVDRIYSIEELEEMYHGDVGRHIVEDPRKREKEKTYRRVGYRHVNGDTFITIYHLRPIFVVLFTLLGLAIAGAVLFTITQNGDKSPIGETIIGERQEEEKEETEMIAEEATIQFDGYGKYTITEEKHSIELHNPDTNTCNFQFTITDEATNTVIARTSLVAPGKYAYVKMTDFYTEAGVYDVIISTAAFTNNNVQLNGVNQTIQLVVED